MTGPTIGARHYESRHKWRDEDDKMIVRLATDGLSAREISRKLSLTGVCVSRMGIIGRLTRLKFRNPNTRESKPLRRYAPRAEKSQSGEKNISLKKALPFIMPNDDPSQASISLAVAKDNHCRWVCGDARLQMICGSPVESGTSFCAEHARRVFATVKPVISNQVSQ